MAEYQDHYRDKVILITGGAGAIGSNLCRAFIMCGVKRVIILDDFSSGYQWNIPNLDVIQVIRGSVESVRDLEVAFSFHPTHVFHLAAFFANQNSVEHPENDLSVNGFGALRTLMQARKHGVTRFVYAASGAGLHGNGLELPLRDDAYSMHLRTPYQVTKMLGELYCNYFFYQFGLPVVKTRFFNCYGPGELPGKYRNVIPNFIYSALKREPLPVLGTGEETRDFTFIDDIIDGVLRAGYYEQAIGQTVNLASGLETSIRELACLINTFTENNAGIIFKAVRKWDIDTRRLASIQFARECLEYQPRVSLNDGLLQTISWFKKNWDLIEQSSDSRKVMMKHPSYEKSIIWR